MRPTPRLSHCLSLRRCRSQGGAVPARCPSLGPKQRSSQGLLGAADLFTKLIADASVVEKERKSQVLPGTRALSRS